MCNCHATDKPIRSFFASWTSTCVFSRAPSTHNWLPGKAHVFLPYPVVVSLFRQLETLVHWSCHRGAFIHWAALPPPDIQPDFNATPISLLDFFASEKPTRDARRCTQCSGNGDSILRCSRWHATHPGLRLLQVFAISFSLLCVGLSTQDVRSCAQELSVPSHLI